MSNEIKLAAEVEDAERLIDRIMTLQEEGKLSVTHDAFKSMLYSALNDLDSIREMLVESG